MLYTLQEATYYASTPMRWMARATRDFWSSPLNPARDSAVGRNIYAAADLYANVTRRYGKPAWGIDKTEVNGHTVKVRETVVWESPWCRLIQFDHRQPGQRNQREDSSQQGPDQGTAVHHHAIAAGSSCPRATRARNAASVSRIPPSRSMRP